MTDTSSNPEAVPLRYPAELTHPGVPAYLTIHRYLPLAALYFFLNQAGLPQGLFYTTLLSPFLFVWLYLKGQRWLTTKLLLVLSPFIVAQVVLGVSSYDFFARSTLLMWTAYVTVYAFAYALLNCENIERLFDQLIALNFVVAAIGLACIFTPLQKLFWMDAADAMVGAPHQLRMALGASEPSIYAELMLPLITFASLRLLHESSKRSLIYLLMICFPFLLAQSFGGLSIGLAGVGAALLMNFRLVLKKPRNFIIFACLAAGVAALLVIPNPISARVWDVLAGSDSSTRSRTIFSFIVAFAVASTKSLWWGAGLGQGKLIDVSDLGVGFTIGVIPNATAGTLAEFGFIGVAVRFAAEIFLFFKTRVYVNSFRLAMFVAAFITQLTGSHLMDVQQYLMWCFAFLPFFPGLDGRKQGDEEISRI